MSILLFLMRATGSDSTFVHRGRQNQRKKFFVAALSTSFNNAPAPALQGLDVKVPVKVQQHFWIQNNKVLACQNKSPEMCLNITTSVSFPPH